MAQKKMVAGEIQKIMAEAKAIRCVVDKVVLCPYTRKVRRYNSMAALSDAT